jgi:hypothetical protein
MVRVLRATPPPTTPLCVRFRDTGYTYMDPHGMPSGGDWAFARTASVVVQGTGACRAAQRGCGLAGGGGALGTHGPGV